jgi:hypothetical protein
MMEAKMEKEYATALIFSNSFAMYTFAFDKKSIKLHNLGPYTPEYIEKLSMEAKLSFMLNCIPMNLPGAEKWKLHSLEKYENPRFLFNLKRKSRNKPIFRAVFEREK